MLDFLQALRKAGLMGGGRGSRAMLGRVLLHQLLILRRPTAHAAAAAALQHVKVGIVGGSDLHKIQEQLGENCGCSSS